MITPAEQRDLLTIVDEAKRAGWLTEEDSVSATRVTHAVVVVCRRAGQWCRKSYADDDRWPYQLLRDLAHGHWPEDFRLRG